MFVARSLHRRSWKALSSFLPANSSKRCVLFDGNSENAIKTELLRSDSILAPSKLPFNYLIGSRSMSSVRGRSMRSRVEKRMQKESGRTLTEIRRAKTLRKKLMTEEERLIFNLRRAKKKVALLLQKLKKYELPELPPPRHDPELLTPEQFQAFKKIGFRNKNYVPVGVRGVFGGVVQNMHMHWKFHETVQVCCDNFPKEKIKEMASMLARLSGGIVINIHNVKTIIMFRGRNYRQPKNLIPINTLTKRKALFKARFEQALDSQKLNIKKYEQELRRKGVNPEDPVAMASIQRVASTFFNAIDKKDGSPYVFHGNNEQTESTSNFLKHPEPGDDSDQEELDKFIADIEDAADKEWAEEEAAEKEEFGRMRYLNREHSGGKYRKFDMRSGEDSGDDNRDAGFQRDQRGRQMSNRHITSDSEEADVEGDSNDVRNESDSESDLDYSTSAPHKFKKSMAGRGDRRELRDVKAKGTLAEEDSGTEDILSDLEDAMWKSDSEQEQEPVRLKVGNYEYRSDDDDDEEGDANETKRDKYRKSRQPEEQRGHGKHSDRTEINSHSFKDTNRKPRRAKNFRDTSCDLIAFIQQSPLISSNMSIIPSVFGGRRSSVFDPFSLDVWDPFKDMSKEASAIVNARVDWKETPEAHVFKADLPGLKKEEVKVEVEDGRVLQISGERSKESEEKNDKWHRIERSSGKFVRRFQLPGNAKMEEVKASIENGVLTVTVPKEQVKKPEVKAIEISG